jgi:hypothetical protein
MKKRDKRRRRKKRKEREQAAMEAGAPDYKPIPVSKTDTEIADMMDEQQKAMHKALGVPKEVLFSDE